MCGAGGTGNFRLFAHPEPIAFERAGDLDEGRKIDGLNQKGISAHFVGLIDVPDLIRSGQDYHSQCTQGRLLANPFEDFEAAFPGHLQIEKEQTGQRIFVAVGIFAFALQIGYGFLAVGDDIERI